MVYMPIGPWIIPAIGAAGSILGNVLTGESQASQNEKARQFSLDMYARQRADSLADWERQNLYNSPQSQMSRLKAAGLNPNLVYGTGAVANNAVAPRSVDAQSWRPEATRYDFSSIGQSAAMYYDVQMKEAQTDNVKAQTSLAAQEAALKAAQTAGIVQGTAKSKFELELAQSLRLNSIQMAEAQLKGLQTSTQVNLNADERAAAMNASNLQKAAEEILSIRLGRAKTESERQMILTQMANVRKDTELKQLDINLRRKGIMPGDNILFRVLARWLDSQEGGRGMRPITKDDFKPGILPDSTLRALGLGSVLEGGDPYRKK